MLSAKNLFTVQERQKIIQSICEAEKRTSAEIRVHIDNFCWINPVKKAQGIFLKQQMHHTQHRNGVLFYISVWHRKLAIIGDKGIYEKVNKQFWDELVHHLISSLKENKHKAETLCECISKVGQALSTYFPASNENPNELSDEISY